MPGDYILVFDHGTTSIRACLMNRDGVIVARNQEQFEQIYPQPGWVEHDADTLWDITLRVARVALNIGRTLRLWG
jgi:glycerol kinase